MIGKISKGASFGGLAAYLFGPGRREEHRDPRTIAGGNVLLDDPRQWATWVADMRLAAGQRPGVARPVWHCSLRTAPEDPVLDDATWAAIAAQHITAMGLQHHPWVAVRHGADHVHIVASRVDAHGRLWRDSHDYARSMRSCRQLEHDHGLTAVTRRRPSDPLASTTAGERARAHRLGQHPERLRLRTAMHTALTAAAGAGVNEWERQLAAHGVRYRAQTTQDGTVIGYRVTLSGWLDADGIQVWLKASQVDRQLSWTRVRPQLDGDSDRALAERELARRTRDDSRRRTRRRTPAGDDRAAVSLARQGFAVPPKPPVVRDGDTEELLQALIIRLHQWRDQQHRRPPSR
jgi:hypothetical protein